MRTHTDTHTHTHAHAHIEAYRLHQQRNDIQNNDERDERFKQWMLPDTKAQIPEPVRRTMSSMCVCMYVCV